MGAGRKRRGDGVEGRLRGWLSWLLGRRGWKGKESQVVGRWRERGLE